MDFLFERCGCAAVILTDLRMLTRGLGTGLLGLLSKLSGSVDDPWPLFLACRASW